VLGAAGLLAVGGGVVLWLLAPDGESSAPARDARPVTLSPAIGPNSVGLSLSGSY
jgi:hypothetical protein